MADSAALFLLEEVKEAISGWKEDLKSDPVKEFKGLNVELDELRNILKDLAEKPSEDPGVGSVLNNIRDVIYDVEDIIESWLNKAAASKAKSKFKRGLSLISPNHNSMARQMKSLRKYKVKDVLEKANMMKSALADVGTSRKQEAWKWRTDPPIRQEKVVGHKDEKNKIIGYLQKPQPKLDIISVIGVAGLGKTTLAWEIYNDEKLCYDFPIRIWVHISQRVNSREVLIQIMKHFTAQMEELYNMSNPELLNVVHLCLSREKFLLVMDDVWKTEHWDDLSSALPYSNGEGKVLITSRDMGVGRHVQQITEPHEQQYMNSTESWELLQLEVFGKTGICPSELEEIGQDICKKCEGVPLTIVVIGGVLRDHYLSSKSDAIVKEKWEEMSRNENLGLQDRMSIIYDVVAVSYNRLPYHLRDCFLYLGVFPAGYEIPTWTLTRLWIAEGFIQPADENRSLEKIAEDILNELISRNLLVVRKRNSMREVKVCLVQDIIRKFCISEAAQQNLFQEIKMEEETHTLAAKMENSHRLCLHYDLDRFFSEKLKGPRVRSFLCFQKDAIRLGPENVQDIYENFLSLRILHSQSIKFHPKLIKLIHLRYIVLCVFDLTLLPEQISQLWNLQTIVVDTNSNLITMKANIWKMIQLRHVKTKAAILLDNTWKGESGENIQTLNRLSPESVTAAFPHKASNLKVLGIYGELAPLFENMPLGNMNHLEKLKLYQASASENRLRHFPDDKRFPPKLKRLTLSNTFLDWKHMSTLAVIPDLEVLKLKDNAFSGIQWEARSGGFVNLEFLLIDDTNLVLWEAEPTTLPSLKHLVLKNCEYLSEIPQCVLEQLENLEIDGVLNSLADSVRSSEAPFKLSIGPHLI